MNKAELVTHISSQTKTSKTMTENVLNSFVEVVVKTVKKGEEVRLVDFGTFCVGKRQERRGINPRTKAEMTIPARKLPKFRPGRYFKKLVK
ncbi:MAG: HU family DNA-binding protein [Deltaproteobacteria bacterium]|nr:HU family DNA-binding protein [Deltaproteobacteria bacterium]